MKSLSCVIHSAAPCPPEIKRQMIDWLGPILNEFYAGSEQFGVLRLSSDEWLNHPGAVGRDDKGVIRITDEFGKHVATGHVGGIYFDVPSDFSYFNDPEKTARAFRAGSGYTYGDIGYLDTEGYLYLTDRRDFVVISGGVNIYPQEIEGVILGHPRVMDVAVFGVPDDDFGEKVVAVVEPVEMTDLDQLAAELKDHCRRELAPYKQPRYGRLIRTSLVGTTASFIRRRFGMTTCANYGRGSSA